MSVTSIGSEKRTLESNSQGEKKPADRQDIWERHSSLEVSKRTQIEINRCVLFLTVANVKNGKKKKNGNVRNKSIHLVVFV